MFSLTVSLFSVLVCINIVLLLVMLASGSFDKTSAPKWCAVVPTLMVFTGPVMTLSCFMLLAQPETLRSVVAFLGDVVDHHTPKE